MGDAARIAVIDLGSNSGRMVVFRVGPGAHLDVVEDARAPLRLGRSLRDGGRLGNDAITRTVEALLDFRAVAAGAGATRTVAIATSAIREASDGGELIARAARDAGIELRVIDGDREAFLGFLGAIHDLPVAAGFSMDVGGGSMELTRFADRARVASWTLPLGSLRLSDRHLRSDPPADREVRELSKEAHRVLRKAAPGRLAAGEELVGIGGTVRNLAKIDRRRVDYPLPLLHGYRIPFGRVEDMVQSLGERPMSRRRAVPGLNPDRADSIVGGGLAVLAAMEAMGASRLVVSSRGVREGIALEERGADLPTPADVRSDSIRNLATRFAAWDEAAASRRASIVDRLMIGLEVDAGGDVREMLGHAATVVDLGRAVDYYERFEHAATLVTSSDLGGFSHPQLALVTSILRLADGGRPGAYRALLDKRARAAASRAAVVLALADELNRRIPPGRPADVGCGWRTDGFHVSAPVDAAWRPRGVADRFHRVFGRRLHVDRWDDD
jgi:exopolyphosphatase / guanosine-5'-triphosphate,3'-diphosphate pyrophosphatase